MVTNANAKHQVSITPLSFASEVSSRHFLSDTLFNNLAQNDIMKYHAAPDTLVDDKTQVSNAHIGGNMNYRLSLYIAFYYLIFGLTLPSIADTHGASLPETVDIVSYAKPAVVFINHRDADGNQMTGTGFLVSQDGHVMTCAHVVAPRTLPGRSGMKSKGITDKIWVRTANGVTNEARRLYCDVNSDIALLALPDGTYPYLRLNNLLPVQGEDVIVIGYPMGQALGKEVSVTRGIVSALRFGGTAFQLDAATNPGNSGGPVMNQSGQVIGIAFAKIKGLEGMNFAISATAAAKITSTFAKPKTQGAEALFEAIKFGNIEQVKRIITKNPALAQAKDSIASTPLHESALEGKTDIAKFLIKNGANVNAKTSLGLTPLYITANQGNMDLIKLLIENGADINAKALFGVTPLFAAAKQGNTEIIRLLIENGADVNAKDSKGGTPLHESALDGKIDATKFLIKNGADVNAKDSDGMTPLHWAAMKEFDIVKLLVENGADVNPKNSDIGTPLHWAAHNGKTDITKFLMDSGAGVNNKDSAGKTPLHWAAMEGKTDTARFLLEHGADVNTKSLYGATPLHESAYWGKPDTAKLLVENGADINAETSDGSTPLSIALTYKHDDIADFLRQHGAK